MIKTQYINLNMIPSGVMPILYCSQYDIGRPLGMVVYNGGEAVDLDAYTCTIEATRTDGTAIIAAVTTDDNVAVFGTTATMTNQADNYPVKLVLFDSDSRRVASLAFIMCVTPKTMDENAESIEEDKSLYQQYTETVQSMIAEIKEDIVDLKKRKVQRYDTVDQMQADTALADGMYARTGGFYTVNDGGGALYRIEASAPDTFSVTLNNGLYAELIFEEPLNALQIGVSENIDNSALLNDALSKVDVYLPAGQYPCNGVTVVHNLHGEGSRVNDRAMGTWLVSNGTGAVLTLGKNAQISGISVWCNASETGIALDTTVYGYGQITNVTVANVSGRGVDLTTGTASVTSRRVYVDGLRVFGTAEYPASIGVVIGGNVGDIKIDNLEVMGCRMGVSFNNRIVSGINWHIWCGCLAGRDNGSWWSRTVGIYFMTGARLNVENLYLDTCHLGIYFNGFGNVVNVKNLTFVEDASAGKVATRDGWVINSDSHFLTNMLTIDGGYITVRGDDTTPYNMMGVVQNSRLNTNIVNTVYALDFLPVATNTTLLRRSAHHLPQYSVRTATESANTYVEVARVLAGASTTYTSDMIIEAPSPYQCKLKISKTSAGYVVSADETTQSVYKTYYKANTAEGYVGIYVLVPDSGTVFTANVFYNAINNNALAVDYGLTRLRSGAESVDYPRDVTIDGTGMIAVAA